MLAILKLKSLDKLTLNLFNIFLKKILNKFNVISKITNLPNNKKRITLLKSPHVNKKSMEQFELKIYKTTVELDFNSYKNLLPLIIINKPKNIKLVTVIKKLGK